MDKKKIRIYLDNCCLNRPFDNKQQLEIRLEANAVLKIRNLITQNNIELVWSYMIDFENLVNPFVKRRDSVNEWKQHAELDVDESDKIIKRAETLKKASIKTKDTLHVSCAIEGNCKYFITTDKVILKKLFDLNEIQAVNPINFIRGIEV